MLWVLWLVILGSAFAQAVSGFGFSLLAIPLLIPVIGAKQAIITATVLSGVLTLGSSLGERRYVQWRPVLTLSGAAMCGIPIGVLILVIADPELLTLAVGVLVVVATLLLSRRPSERQRGPGMLAGAGVVSGVLLSSTGMNGPPVVMAFQSTPEPPRKFRASLQASFLIQDALAIAGFAIVGQLDGATLLLSSTAVPLLAVGWWLGNLVFAHVSTRLFRKIVLAMLLTSGVLAIVEAAASLW